jgi:hypothetical protein
MWNLLFDVWQQVPQMDSRLYRCYKTCYHLPLGMSQQQDISDAPLLPQTEHYLSVLMEFALHTLGRILKMFCYYNIIIMITFSNNLNRKLITINVCVYFMYFYIFYFLLPFWITYKKLFNYNFNSYLFYYLHYLSYISIQTVPLYYCIFVYWQMPCILM